MTSDSNGRDDPRGTPLECQAEVISHCTVIHVAGEVDLATIHVLERALDAAIAARRPIVVDLAAAKYMDSSGLRVLLRAKQRHERALALAAPTPTLRRVFEIARIDRTILLYGTLDEALSAICASTPPGGIPRLQR